MSSDYPGARLLPYTARSILVKQHWSLKPLLSLYWITLAFERFLDGPLWGEIAEQRKIIRDEVLQTQRTYPSFENRLYQLRRDLKRTFFRTLVITPIALAVGISLAPWLLFYVLSPFMPVPWLAFILALPFNAALIYPVLFALGLVNSWLRLMVGRSSLASEQQYFRQCDLIQSVSSLILQHSA